MPGKRPDSPPAERRDDDWYLHGLFETAQRYIDEHHPDPALDASAIARAIGCSRSALYRMFARRRLKVMDYLREVRLRESRLALTRLPALPIGEVAARCGFADQASFGRQFRQRFGEPPGAYRRRMQGEDETTGLQGGTAGTRSGTPRLTPEEDTSTD